MHGLSNHLDWMSIVRSMDKYWTKFGAGIGKAETSWGDVAKGLQAEKPNKSLSFTKNEKGQHEAASIAFFYLFFFKIIVQITYFCPANLM